MKNKNKISFGLLILFLLLMWSSIGFSGTSYRPNRALSPTSPDINIDADQVDIDDTGNKITATEVEGALQENRTAIDLSTTHKSSDGSDHSKIGINETAIDLNTTHKSSDGSDHSFIDQDVKSGSSPTFDSLDLNSGKITELADATNPTDAANLRTVLDQAGVTRFFYLGSKTLDQLFTDGSDDYYPETQDSQNDDILTNIYFVASEADTLAPMTLKVGAIVNFSFNAKVLATAGKGDVTLYLNFGYVDADGFSNFVKVGGSTDSTSVLTTTSTRYDLHVHVTADTTIPITKRLYVQVVLDCLNTTYTDVWFYYNESPYHMSFSVGASILENFLTTTFKTVEKSADAVDLTADECKSTLITNKGWDGADDQTFTFSEADTDEANGLRCKILMAVTDADNDFYLDTEGNTTQFYLNGIPLGDGVRIVLENPTIGESIVCHTATLDGTTFDLYCDAINGAWVDKGS